MPTKIESTVPPEVLERLEKWLDGGEKEGYSNRSLLPASVISDEAGLEAIGLYDGISSAPLVVVNRVVPPGWAEAIVDLLNHAPAFIAAAHERRRQREDNLNARA